jgi:tetratricopeptide (TPR) repeat protein
MPLSEDICANLAHVHLAQGRLVDAEHLYQAALKALPKSHSSGGGSSAKQADKIVAAHECMALAQFRHGRHEDALRSLLRGLHNDPTCLREWYNVAVVRADYGMSLMKRQDKSADDIDDAVGHLQLAQRLFGFLATVQIPQGKGLQYDKKIAAKKEKFCEVNMCIKLPLMCIEIVLKHSGKFGFL